MLSIKEQWQKPFRVPERTLKTPLTQRSSSSSRDEESQWLSAEDTRWRRVAFEEAAKRMLRYTEDSEDLKVGVTELQEQLGISEEAGILHQANCSAGNERAIANIFLKFFGKEKNMYALPA